MLKEKDLQLFNDSLERCLAGEGFIEGFYDRFIHASPQIAEMFRNTDMDRQHRMLRGSIYLCMMASKNLIQVRGRLVELGDRHNELGVRPLYYSFWLESLVEAVRVFDPRFTDQIEDIWRTVMAPGIRVLISRYTGPDDEASLVKRPGVINDHVVKRVRSVMSSPVITVEMDDSLARVRALMDEHAIHHVVVMDNKRPVGIISDRDVKLAVSPYAGTMGERLRDLKTLEKRAHQVMTRQMVTIAPDAAVELAGQMLADQNVSCLPVLDATSGNLVGIVSWKDIIRDKTRSVTQTG